MDISVVICAYTEQRWDELAAAVQSVEHQIDVSPELIIVIDHNPQLFARALEAFRHCTVVENREQRGLSGARNSGIALARREIVAFMDEDAVAEPRWLHHLLLHYTDTRVVGVGGQIRAMWQHGRPSWFPEEFDWVVGCTYKGMPTCVAPVRNLIGCNMSFRRQVFDEVGGFTNGIGRIGTRPVGCEETEICIRAAHHWPRRIFVYDPDAVVLHRVPATRSKWAYFQSRCFYEGLSKAVVSKLVGANAALASERVYTLRALPQGVSRGLVDTMVSRRRAGALRSLVIVAGLAATTAGYIVGLLQTSRAKNAGPGPLFHSTSAQPEQRSAAKR